MADVKNIITLGLGASPGNIRYFVLFGLDVNPTALVPRGFLALSTAVVTGLALAHSLVSRLASVQGSLSGLSLGSAAVSGLSVADDEVTNLTAGDS